MGSEQEVDYRKIAEQFRTLHIGGGTGSEAAEIRNIVLGRNILQEDLEQGGGEGATYNLDQESRDRLLAHSRQDIASAVAMARSALQEAHKAARLGAEVRALRWLLLFSVLVNCAVLVAVLMR